ncbi:MAG TPA: aldo/keto reductase [Propionibacteriaceae bacterium]|nr:aldo/keto reductase [Propionibacteriaceae bacterium]
MEYRLMGKTGLSVSRLCLGTMTFGNETDEAGSHAQLDAFAEAGGTFIDTADVYSAGRSEEMVGSWLKKRSDIADGMVIATKGRFPMANHPNGVGLSRRHLTQALDGSLRRLGVDCIDVYQVHAWDPLTPLDETIRFFDDAMAAGKIHYFGLSNFIGWQIAAVSERARAAGAPAPVMLQPQYNLLTRMIEVEVLPACQEYGIGIISWSPLGGGWLTGKYQRDHVPTGATRLGEDPKRGMENYADRNAQEQVWEVLDAVEKVAQETGLTMAQVALAWVADRAMVIAPILGNRTMEQLTEALAMADVHLDAAHTTLLDDVSAPPLPEYPYGPRGVQQRSRPITGGRAS